VEQGKFDGQRPEFYHCATQPTDSERQFFTTISHTYFKIPKKST